jgi:hypothetical protein
VLLGEGFDEELRKEMRELLEPLVKNHDFEVGRGPGAGRAFKLAAHGAGQGRFCARRLLVSHASCPRHLLTASPAHPVPQRKPFTHVKFKKIRSDPGGRRALELAREFLAPWFEAGFRVMDVQYVHRHGNSKTRRNGLMSCDHQDKFTGAPTFELVSGSPTVSDLSGMLRLRLLHCAGFAVHAASPGSHSCTHYSTPSSLPCHARRATRCQTWAGCPRRCACCWTLRRAPASAPSSSSA